MNIKLMNKIAKVGTDVFGAAYTVSDAVEAPDAIMVRSAAMHDYAMNPELKAIARAGAGVNNIPVAEKSLWAFLTVSSTDVVSSLFARAYFTMHFCIEIRSNMPMP